MYLNVVEIESLCRCVHQINIKNVLLKYNTVNCLSKLVLLLLFNSTVYLDVLSSDVLRMNFLRVLLLGALVGYFG